MENKYLVLDSNDDFMPFIIEEILDNDKYKIYRIGHYSEMEGEKMRDPEQNIILVKSTGEYIPYSLRQDYAGVNENSMVIENGEVFEINSNIHAYLVYFCECWLKSIEHQQNLKI
jgi:hypothetical protein